MLNSIFYQLTGAVARLMWVPLIVGAALVVTGQMDVFVDNILTAQEAMATIAEKLEALGR